ncbi:hypothetical protein SLNSH_08685 [Alsobacter soli]|uniref:Beta-mannosidase n=1 Tax=Alsobacter soli TaxID=2109933 RepID=A0A2T1HUK9_9HYPH|nr:hypothetical protein [Alsobacter soli]PSC05280.1 hypothetical protein SLNSH_08685 [Alsobacter soli]
MFKDDFALQSPLAAPVRQGLPWIQAAHGAPYFQTEDGEAWHPIGANEAISWRELSGLFRRRDLASADAYLADLAANGVTTLRLMLEYAQVRHRYFERPAGRFPRAMVQLWDDLFALCQKHGLRLLLTPFDTFWTWLHWRHHPYNRANGGPLAHPSEILLCRETRNAIKARLEFAVRRWGGSGTLFAWDLWNEIHPAQAGETAECFPEFIADLSGHVRRLELSLYGRSHPQTVSIFGPELEWRAHMPLTEPIFRHPDLDFATVHVYQMGTIDDPRDTIAPALDMARHVRAHLAEITDGRPYCDSEHGPIHTFKDKKITLPEAFDDEYFRHIQWAHLAAGGAGGGMRWPNRRPHRLTPGMRREQAKLAAFLPEVDWLSFRRESLDVGVQAAGEVHAMACGDERQALLYLLRGDAVTPDGMVDANAAPLDVAVSVPGLADGAREVTLWDTAAGGGRARFVAESRDRVCRFTVPGFTTDLMVALRPAR